MDNRISDYFKSKRVSNSMLSGLHNPRWIKIKMMNPDTEDEDRKAFRIGGALDCLLTDPDRWEKGFFVSDAVRPSGFMGKFVENLPCGLNPESASDLYLNGYEKSGYKIKIERVIENMWKNEEVVKYYKSVCEVTDKIILSKDEYELVVKCKDLILANEFTHTYFVDWGNWGDDIELLHQYPIYFDYNGFECKGLLDGLKIDHKNKKIYPFDLKTTSGGVYNFAESFLKWGYYRQCAFYELGLSFDPMIIELLEKGYTIENFMFIVVDSKLSSSQAAVLYETSKRDRECGLKGCSVGNRYYKGINDLMEELRFHMETDYWDLPKEVYLNKGVIKLDIFNAE